MTDKLPAAATVGLISLGCAKNLVDSEVMLGELESRGHRIVGDLAEAETVIVNTCGFVEEAKQESIDAILEVARSKAAGERRLLVAGCMVNRYGRELEQAIPEIDGFIGLDDLRRVGELVSIGGEAPPPSPSHLVFDHTAPRKLTTRGYAYLKVAEGCDNPCTFCAIPLWRGRFRSRPVADLVAEARQLEKQGVRELCLIAQDTTRYGEDLGLKRSGMRRLVEELLAATQLPWIRFLYAYPTTLDESLLRLMAAEERFVPYLDISGRAPRALRASPGLRRPGPLRSPRGLRLQPRGGHPGGRAGRPRAGRHRSPPASAPAGSAAPDRPGQPAASGRPASSGARGGRLQRE